MEWRQAEELCNGFFVTDSGAPFTDTGIGGSYYDDNSIPLEVALDVPDLLRALIPYAHAQSGIRDELTSRAIAAVDELRPRYKREVSKQAMFDALCDAV
jgi:hypothetical protein